MAVYHDWRRKHYGLPHKRSTKPPKPTTFRIYYLYGPEYILIDEIIEAVTERVNATELSKVTLAASETEERDIWAEVNQFPIYEADPKLVIIRDAEMLQDWTPLRQWLKDAKAMPNAHLIFVSNEHKVDTNREPFDWLKRPSTTIVVKCGPLNSEDSIDYLQWRCQELDRYTAMYLLKQTGDNLRIAAETLKKATFFPSGVSNALIDALIVPTTNIDFVEELISLRKGRALKAIEKIPEDEYGRILGQLDHHLELLARINSAQRFHRTAVDIVKASKVSRFWVNKLRDHARFYTPQKVVTRAQILSVLDEQHRRGEHQGLLEVLVALW